MLHQIVFGPANCTACAAGIFLVDGVAAGFWRWGQSVVEIQPFAPLTPAQADEVMLEADQLAVFHNQTAAVALV